MLTSGTKSKAERLDQKDKQTSKIIPHFRAHQDAQKRSRPVNIHSLGFQSWGQSRAPV